MNTTTVLQYFAGPGCGKSTLAAQLFAEFKIRGKSVEYASEWIKGWAWEGRKPSGLYDALYVFAKQLKAESRLYGKVDYIITDSPLGLGWVYEQIYTPDSWVMHDLYKGLLKEEAKQNRVERVNFRLLRCHPYVQAGRFEDEETAKRVDEMCRVLHGGVAITSTEEAIKECEERGYL